MEIKTLKSNLVILCALFVVVISCKNLKNDYPIVSMETTLDGFIPAITKGKKYQIFDSMTNIFENDEFLVQQFDDVTFIIKSKSQYFNFCIKYSGGDNIYYNNSYKPAAVFLLDKKLSPISMIHFEKNSSYKKFKYSKIDYSPDHIYLLTHIPTNNEIDILSMKIKDVKILLIKIEKEKLLFSEKIEMPIQFKDTPLWEISW